MNKDQFFFSVVIPVYNQVKLVQEALQSVFIQRMDNYEVIVVDDGSNDGTTELLSNVNRITLLHQERLGPGAARNKGITNCKGKYVAFLDSDDLWFPWTLENYYKVIKKYDSPSIIGGCHIDISKSSDIETVKERPCEDIYYKDYLDTARDAVWLGTCGTVIKKNVLKGGQSYISADINGEDSDLWLSLGTAPGFVFINDPPLFAYRRRNDSRIYDHKKTIAGSMCLINREKKGEYPGSMKRKHDRLQIITRHIRPVVIASIHNRNLKDAWKIYCGSFIWHLILYRIRFILAVPFMLIISCIKGYN